MLPPDLCRAGRLRYEPRSPDADHTLPHTIPIHSLLMSIIYPHRLLAHTGDRQNMVKKTSILKKSNVYYILQYINTILQNLPVT